MADSSDVEIALVTAVGTALYPSGLPVVTPPALPVSTVAGVPVRIVRGWPNGEAVDIDLRAGIANCTIFPMRGGFRNISAPQLQWIETASTVPTLTVSAAPNLIAIGAPWQVTFGGTCGTNQVAAVLIGSAGGQQAAFAYRCLATDTPATVANAFAAAIPQATSPTTSDVLYVPAWNGPVSAQVVADGTAALAVQYQERAVIVTAWAPTPGARDAMCSAIGAQLGYQYRVTADDGSQITWRQTNDVTNDVPSRDAVWRRDMTYTCRYTTVVTATQPRMVALLGNATVSAGAIIQIGAATLPAQVYSDSISGLPLVDAAGRPLGVEVLT